MSSTRQSIEDIISSQPRISVDVFRPVIILPQSALSNNRLELQMETLSLSNSLRPLLLPGAEASAPRRVLNRRAVGNCILHSIVMQARGLKCFNRADGPVISVSHLAHLSIPLRSRTIRRSERARTVIMSEVDFAVTVETIQQIDTQAPFPAASSSSVATVAPLITVPTASLAEIEKFQTDIAATCRVSNVALQISREQYLLLMGIMQDNINGPPSSPAARSGSDFHASESYLRRSGSMPAFGRTSDRFGDPDVALSPSKSILSALSIRSASPTQSPHTAPRVFYKYNSADVPARSFQLNLVLAQVELTLQSAKSVSTPARNSVSEFFPTSLPPSTPLSSAVRSSAPAESETKRTDTQSPTSSASTNLARQSARAAFHKLHIVPFRQSVSGHATALDSSLATLRVHAISLSLLSSLDQSVTMELQMESVRLSDGRRSSSNAFDVQPSLHADELDDEASLQKNLGNSASRQPIPTQSEHFRAFSSHSPSESSTRAVRELAFRRVIAPLSDIVALPLSAKVNCFCLR